MRQPLLDAVKGLDPAVGGPEIDGEAMLARIHQRVREGSLADVTHLVPRTRSRPAQRLAMGAAALAVVVAVALVLTLVQPGPQAYATWDATPTLVPPTSETVATCPDTDPAAPDVPIEPVLADQRGAYTFAVLTGDDVVVECLVSVAGEDVYAVAQGVSSGEPDAFELGEAPVLVVDPGGTWGGEAGEGPITTVVGIADDDVTAIEISTENGLTAQAAVDDGWWSVWFPGEVDIAADLVVTTPEGRSTLSLDGLIAPGLG